MMRALLVLAVVGLASGASAQTYPELTVTGQVIENGIFDPTVEYVPDGSVGWLFYSWVGGGLSPWGPTVETHVARTLDQGATWTFVREVNPVFPDTVDVPGQGLTDGQWNYEVASVAYDPNDPGREWKLFAHRLFRPLDPNGLVLIDHIPTISWIIHRWAPDPNGPWSPEVALFSNASVLVPPFTTQVDVNSLDPNVPDIVVYTEPGALFHDNVLYVSLTGIIGTAPGAVVVLSSADHGATWDFAGTAVTNADLVPLGFQSLDGTSIVEQAGRVFLIGTPESATWEHDGTIVLEFLDLSKGLLRRTSGGNLLVHKHVPPQPALFSFGRGGGQADYHRHHAGGMLQPQLDFGALPLAFHIFETGESPLDLPGPGAIDTLPRLAIAILVVLLALALARSRSKPV